MSFVSLRIRGPRLAGLVAIVLLALGADGTLATPPASATDSGGVFVNEFHYDNVGTDQGEGIELAGPAGTDLSAYSLELYNGYDQTRYATIALSGELPDQQNGYGTMFFAVPGLQNGAPDGIALIGPEGVEETLGYEGTFTAADGTAAGDTFVDIKQFEAPSTPVGLSLQLQGSGRTAGDFHWHSPTTATPNQVNTDEHFLGSTPPSPPASTALPAISGNPTVGETLACSTGSWTNSPSEYSYEWNENGIGLSAHSATYVVQGADANADLSCTVTATNGAGSTSATSEAIAIQPLAPVNTAPPTISGETGLGETLWCSTGSWENEPNEYSYEWDEDGSPISDTAESLLVEGWSEGHTLTCTVTAHNSTGASAPATSSGVEVRVPAPVNIELPAISGTPRVGESLTCSTGSWEHAPTAYTYQWSRDAVAIAQRTSEKYIVQAADEGHLLSCEVVAWNLAGPGSASISAAVEAQITQQGVGVLPGSEPPLNTALPVISGLPLAGQTLKCSSGSWENRPTAYAYSWTRDAHPIPGAVTAGLQLGEGDVGYEVDCIVTATNGSGERTAEAKAVHVTARGAAAGHDGGKENTGWSGASSAAEQLQQVVQPVGPKPSPTGVAASLATLLRHKWSRSATSSLIAHGSYPVHFDTPTQGVLEARLTAHGRRGKSIVFASGSGRFSAGAQGRIQLVLTRAGRALLRRRHALLLTEAVIFRPSAGGVQTMQATVTLRRR